MVRTTSVGHRPLHRAAAASRSSVARVVAVAASMLLSQLALPAFAQSGAGSLFELLFGQKRQVPRHELPAVVPQKPLKALPAAIEPDGNLERAIPRPAKPKPVIANGYGGYQTMCVRLCDGYYWPVRFGVASNGFHRDKNVCEQSCGGEAELFYKLTGNNDIANMRNLATGKPYRKLTNAFRYRKAFDPQCRCKAEPWSEAAQLRHASYASAAQNSNGGFGLPIERADSWNVTLAVEPSASLIARDGLLGVAGAVSSQDLPAIAVAINLTPARITAAGPAVVGLSWPGATKPRRKFVPVRAAVDLSLDGTHIEVITVKGNSATRLRVAAVRRLPAAAETPTVTVKPKKKMTRDDLFMIINR